tara:strand:+ start:42 stop:503 length:462 start_codon:yes stop_codon:yes gene_type:complete
MRYQQLIESDFNVKWWDVHDGDYPFRAVIGDAIGANEYANWNKVGAPWNDTEMIGGGGSYILKGPFGYVMLDASIDYERGKPARIGLGQISISNRSAGVGSKIMNAIKQYSDKTGLPFAVYKATNKPFFNKFSWLTHDGNGHYVYNPSDKEKR